MNTLKFSKKRLALAFAIAGISDAIGVFTTPLPPIGWVADLAIGAIKEILRDLLRQLLRIERRVKASFQSNARLSADQEAGRKEPSLNEQSAGQVIEKLKEKVSKGEQVEAQLKQYSVKPDLQIIARLLGMTNTKLPPKDELIRRISTRLRQSVSVITGIRDREKRRE